MNLIAEEWAEEWALADRPWGWRKRSCENN